MKKLLAITLLLISNLCFSQLKSVIINSETKEKIPYVNIWVENENIGTTSNEKGGFILEIDSTKIILFSAIGFETKKIRILTKSDVKDSKFNIRLYGVSENGEPENYIFDQNIIGIAKKGKKTTENDIIAKAPTKMSNHKKLINNFLKMAENPYQYWDKLNYNEKRTYQNILFPDGLRFSLKNKECRTPKMNLMLELTNCYSDCYTNKKEKTQKLKAFESRLVAGTGFIPPEKVEMGQRGEQPKETPIALQSDFFFCSQDDASIT